ncbi:MAG: hypothetical protein PUB43_08280 [Oscillospiraceae bacterium]|nr:hypothetical protein [Oscillospiraceae bacterium]
MKKIISFLLVVVMSLTVVAPTFAVASDDIDFQNYRSQIPIINIYGDGEPIYNAEGEKIFHFSQMVSMLVDHIKNNMSKEDLETLGRAIAQGLVLDQWDPCYEALEVEVGKLFAEVRLDENGEKHDGSDVSKERRAQIEKALQTDAKEAHGYYPLCQYEFWYDWRLDPMETADEFNAYVKGVKAITGAEKVAIYSKCLGTSVVTAYIAKYGLDDIHGISIDTSVSNGAEILSEPVSGKFIVDANAVNRFLMDMDSLEMASIDAFITETIDLAIKTGAVEATIHAVEDKYYDKLLRGMTSALALSTFYTWPNYWSCVVSEDYEQAKNLVFGAEDSEKRREYAGLIEKIDRYDVQVRQHTEEIMKSIGEQGVNIVILSKYGSQLVPICQSCDEVSDQFVTVKRSSYGATTGTIYEPLSADYIAKAKAAGKEKYISPDKLIDASTCLYPDSTWFLKGVSHSAYTIFQDTLLYIGATAPRQVTVDDFNCSQYVVFDKTKSNRELSSFSAMTEENCHTEAWEADAKVDKPQGFFGRIYAFFHALRSWFTMLINKIFHR